VVETVAAPHSGTGGALLIAPSDAFDLASVFRTSATPTLGAQLALAGPRRTPPVTGFSCLLSSCLWSATVEHESCISA
jgi:hypothetical protein